MPILDVDKARTVMVIKRSMNPGFAGIDNPLYYLDNTLMLFGDAKAFVGDIVRELRRRVSLTASLNRSSFRAECADFAFSVRAFSERRRTQSRNLSSISATTPRSPSAVVGAQHAVPGKHAWILVADPPSRRGVT